MPYLRFSRFSDPITLEKLALAIAKQLAVSRSQLKQMFFSVVQFRAMYTILIKGFGQNFQHFFELEFICLLLIF